MDRREFVHITALGSAAGVLSFTGLGLLWGSDDADGSSHDGGTDATQTRSPFTSSHDPTDPSPTSTATEHATVSDDPSVTVAEGTPTAEPTAEQTDDPTPEPTADPQATTTTSRDHAGSPTASPTPAPWRNVDSRFRTVDDKREVYVNLENRNDYAVDVRVSVSWGYADGTEATETRSVRLEAGDYWAESISRDHGGKSIESWGHGLDVRKA